MRVKRSAKSSLRIIPWRRLLGARPAPTFFRGLLLVLLMPLAFGLIGAKERYAQGKTWMGRSLLAQIENARFQLGPFRISPVFVLRNVGYDSNIYYGATGEPVEDVTFTAGLAFNIYLPIKKK